MHRFSKRGKTALFMLLAVLLAAGCAVSADMDGVAREYPEYAEWEEAYPDSYAFSLLGEVYERADGGNVLISPLSVEMALLLVYQGADGATKSEMAKVLGVAGMDDEAVNRRAASLLYSLGQAELELNVANSIWVNKGLPVSRSFAELAKDYYGARSTELDFASPSAAKTINQWVRNQTKNKIDSIVSDPLDPNVVMVLLNAVYFKGDWTEAFKGSATREAPFRTGSGAVRSHPLMHQTGEMPYMAGDGFQAAALDYGDGRFRFVLLLPDEGTELNALRRQLNAARWGEWRRQLSPRKVELALPRFKLEEEILLNDTLAGLGMASAFDQVRADFSRMVEAEGPRLFINEVRHKTYMEMNEQGTKAAAVTSVAMMPTGAPAPQERAIMRADRPFLFLVEDTRTGAILFMGAIQDPRE